MVHRLRRLHGRDDGAVTTVAVLLISILFVGLSALVVDMGLARDTRRQAQNAADASVLAAGNKLYLNTTLDVAGAVAAAKSYASSNYGVTPSDWAACRDASSLAYTPDAPDTCISFESASAPASVRVRIPVRQVTTTFGRIWGVGSIPVGAAAQIQLVPGSGPPCGVCVVGAGAHSLQNGSILVSGANVALNGTLDAGPQGNITVSGSGAGISLQGSQPSKGAYSPQPLVNQTPVVDPLANLVMPNYKSPLLFAQTNSCTDGPGIYSVISTSSCTMKPGLYVITGTNHLSGQTNIIANGVTLYFVCSTSGVPHDCVPGESGGDLQVTGQATLRITAPTSDPNKGLSIVSDRNNTATLSVRGNGTQPNTGTIYAASGTLDIVGNGASNNLDSLVVVGNMTFSGGNGVIQGTYTQANNVTITSGDLHLSE